jgi:hypothetical protein
MQPTCVYTPAHDLQGDRKSVAFAVRAEKIVNHTCAAYRQIIYEHTNVLKAIFT